MNQRRLFWHFRILIFDVLKNFHWVIFSIEYFSHCLHMAFGYWFFIPQIFKLWKCVSDCLFKFLLIFSGIRLVRNFIYIKINRLLSSEGSWILLALLCSFFLLGNLNLFFKSENRWEVRYIENEVSFDNYTRGCDQDGSVRSSRFPININIFGYFLF